MIRNENTIATQKRDTQNLKVKKEKKEDFFFLPLKFKKNYCEVL